MLSVAPVQIKRKSNLAFIQDSAPCWDTFTIPSLVPAGPGPETPIYIPAVTQVRTAPVACSCPLPSFLQPPVMSVISPILVTAFLNTDVNWQIAKFWCTAYLNCLVSIAIHLKSHWGLLSPLGDTNKFMPAFKEWMSRVTSYFIEMIFWNLLLLVREGQQCHPSQQYCEGEITHCLSAPHILGLLLKHPVLTREKGTTVS